MAELNWDQVRRELTEATKGHPAPGALPISRMDTVDEADPLTAPDAHSSPIAPRLDHGDLDQADAEATDALIKHIALALLGDADLAP